MIDRENVIKGLKYCTEAGHNCNMSCPYYETVDCEWFLKADALILLDAQKPIESRLHLCESCKKQYPKCDAKKDGVVFGSGTGNDNIIGCTAYVNRWMPQNEPRAMTLEEAQGADYCWYENRAMNYCLIVSATMSANVQRNGGRPQTQLEIIGSERCGFMYDDDYGKVWRCWDKEPTEEQRRATLWN